MNAVIAVKPTGNATFETGVPTWEAWDGGHLVDNRLIAVLDGSSAGRRYCAVSDRCVYGCVAENSVYVAAAR